MADTHINAYYADVEEKKEALVRAQGEYQAALDALDAKKKEIGLVDEPETAPSQESTVRQVPMDRPKGKK